MDEKFKETGYNRSGFDGAQSRWVLNVIRNNKDIVREFLGLPPQKEKERKDMYLERFGFTTQNENATAHCRFCGRDENGRRHNGL